MNFFACIYKRWFHKRNSIVYWSGRILRVSLKQARVAVVSTQCKCFVNIKLFGLFYLSDIVFGQRKTFYVAIRNEGLQSCWQVLSWWSPISLPSARPLSATWTQLTSPGVPPSQPGANLAWRSDIMHAHHHAHTSGHKTKRPAGLIHLVRQKYR